MSDTDVTNQSGDNAVTADQFRAPSWWRHRWKIVVVLAIALTIWPGRSLWLAFWATPSPTMEYVDQINALLDTSIPDEENAWPLYREAIIEFQDRLDEFQVANNMTHPRNPHPYRAIHYLMFYQDGTGFKRETLLPIADHVRPVLTTLDQAAVKAHFVRPYDLIDDVVRGTPLSGGARSRHIGESAFAAHRGMDQIALFNASEILRGFEESNDEEALRRIATGLRLARHLTHQPLPYDWIRGSSMYSFPLSQIQFYLAEHDVDAAMCDRLIAILEELRFPAMGYTHVIEGKRLQDFDEINWLYSASGFAVLWEDWRGPSQAVAAGKWVFAPSIRERFNNLVAYRSPRKSDAIAMVQEYYDRALRAFDTDDPLIELLDVNWKGFDRLGSNIDHDDVQRWVNGGADDDELGLYSFVRLRAGARPAESDRRLTLVALHLERHHAIHGTWPTSLDELELGHIMIDPESEQPFAYRPIPDDPAGVGYYLQKTRFHDDRSRSAIAPRQTLDIAEGANTDIPRFRAALEGGG